MNACDVEPYDLLLKKYVHEGRVNYGSWRASEADLKAFENYLSAVGSCDVSNLTGLDHYAFWVNAYNAFNIKGVLDHWPVQNIKAIDGFLDKKMWRVANLDLTLNDMEYKQLIPPHKDARAHFAVVCADLGSVPIAGSAYTAANLESQLEAKTKEFVRDRNNFDVDTRGKRVRVSKLFAPDWYEKDFLTDPRFKGSRAVEYLAPYVAPELAAFLKDAQYTVEYIDWDWSLNASAK